MHMAINAGGDSHTQSPLYGGGPSLTNSSGVPWTAAYIYNRDDPICDLRSNIAAESGAKIIYKRLINITDDPGIKDALGFLMTREIAHQKSFEKALYPFARTFPPGKLPGLAQYASLYVNTSQGEGDANGPWNTGEQWDRLDSIEEDRPLDGSDGKATVRLSDTDKQIAAQMQQRLQSDPGIAPSTSAPWPIDTSTASPPCRVLASDCPFPCASASGAAINSGVRAGTSLSLAVARTPCSGVRGERPGSGNISLMGRSSCWNDLRNRQDEDGWRGAFRHTSPLRREMESPQPFRRKGMVRQWMPPPQAANSETSTAVTR